MEEDGKGFCFLRRGRRKEERQKGDHSNERRMTGEGAQARHLRAPCRHQRKFLVTWSVVIALVLVAPGSSHAAFTSPRPLSRSAVHSALADKRMCETSACAADGRALRRRHQRARHAQICPCLMKGGGDDGEGWLLPSALLRVREEELKVLAPRLRSCDVLMPGRPAISTCYIAPGRYEEPAHARGSAALLRGSNSTKDPATKEGPMSDKDWAALSKAAALQQLERLLDTPGSVTVPDMGGAPLVLIHGFDSSCLEWRRLLPRLEEQGFECWALDILGWGQTSVPKDVSADSKRQHLAQFIRDVIRERVTLVGASYGANIAVDLALEHPDLVARLVLIDAPTLLDGLPFARAAQSLPGLDRLLAAGLASRQLRSAAALLARAGGQDLPLGYGMDPSGTPRLKRVASILVWCAEHLITHVFRGWRAQGGLGADGEALEIGALSALSDYHQSSNAAFLRSGGYFLSEAVRALRPQTLVLWGGGDVLLPVETHAKPLVDAIGSRASLEIIEGVGHLPHWEAPEATAAAIGAWLHHDDWICSACGNEEVVGCPNCDALGFYVAYNRRIKCKCCHGSGRVVCRACFRGDPWDRDGVARRMRSLPD